MEKINIIIVNWNTGKLLSQCLRSINELPSSDKQCIDQIVVVDNASSDNSLQFAKNLSVGVPINFIDLDNNAGFARANNIAINKVGFSNHILLLNPDTEVKESSISKMLAALQADKRIGIVGPRLLEKSGKPQPSVRSLPTTGSLAFVFLKFHHFFPEAKVWQQYTKSSFDYNTRQDVDQVMGAAFLIKKETIADIGLLDERFWIWFEEVDYCKRAKNNNWRIIYTPNATVMHYGGVSFGQLVGYRKSLPFFSSALKYAHKHLGFVSYLVLLLITPISLLLVLPASLVHVISKRRNQTQL